MTDNSTTLRPRLKVLLDRMRGEGGPWSPARVGSLYGRNAPKGTTHARDLARLHRAGLATRHSGPKGRFYTVKEPA